MMPMSLSPRPDRLTTSMSSGRQSGRDADAFGDRVRALERGHDAFRPSQPLSGGESFCIGSGDIFGAAQIMQCGMLRTHRGIVQTGGHGVGQRNLPGIILQ